MSLVQSTVGETLDSLVEEERMRILKVVFCLLLFFRSQVLGWVEVAGHSLAVIC
jgi:hypothetical protein